MMPALRGLQQRDCSGVSPDSLLSLEDSETLLEGEESALSTKPPQRYDNFRIYQSVNLPFLRKKWELHELGCRLYGEELTEHFGAGGCPCVEISSSLSLSLCGK